jgi:predicted NBD/HSP70 family sugar kinase
MVNEGRMTATNGDARRSENLSRVLERVWKKPGISRADIARELGMYKSTVSNVVGFLIEKGVLFEAEEGESQPQGGRKPIILRLKGGRFCALGIELRPSSWRAVALDLGGEMLLEKAGPSKGLAVREILRSAVGDLEGDMGRLGIPALALSIAAPGPVDAVARRILGPGPFGAADVELGTFLDADYGLPVIVQNEAAAGAWCRLMRRDAPSMTDFLYLSVERRGDNPITGAAGEIVATLAVVAGGKVHRGAHSAAGALTSSLWRVGLEGQTSSAGGSQGRGGAEGAAYRAFLEEVLRNLVPIVSVLDPEALVIGGDLRIEEDIEALIAERLGDTYFNSPRNRCRIEYSPYGYLDAARGAAAWVIGKMLSGTDQEEGVPGFGWDEVLKAIESGPKRLLRS